MCKTLTPILETTPLQGAHRNPHFENRQFNPILDVLIKSNNIIQPCRVKTTHTWISQYLF